MRRYALYRVPVLVQFSFILWDSIRQIPKHHPWSACDIFTLPTSICIYFCTYILTENQPTVLSVSVSSVHYFLRPLVSSDWGEWTEWGHCDGEGLQHRTRCCAEGQEAAAGLCRGNITMSRSCRPHEVPGRRRVANRSLCVEIKKMNSRRCRMELR